MGTVEQGSAYEQGDTVEVETEDCSNKRRETAYVRYFSRRYYHIRRRIPSDDCLALKDVPLEKTIKQINTVRCRTEDCLRCALKRIQRTVASRGNVLLVRTKPSATTAQRRGTAAEDRAVIRFGYKAMGEALPIAVHDREEAERRSGVAEESPETAREEELRLKIRRTRPKSWKPKVKLICIDGVRLHC